MPLSCTRTLATGPPADTFTSASLKRRSRQTSELDMPPSVPRGPEPGAASALPSSVLRRQLLSTASPRWRARISSSVGAPPVAERSIWGVSVACCAVTEDTGAASSRDKRNVYRSRVMRSVLYQMKPSWSGRAAGIGRPTCAVRQRDARDPRTPDVPKGSAALLLVGGAPAPGARAEAPCNHALAVDIGDHVAIPRQQGLCRAHLGADGQFALGDPVAAVFLELGLAVVFLGATGAEGTFVHLATASEVACLRELRRTERARVEAVTTPDAEILGVQNHPVGRLVEAVHRADRHTGCIRAMHTGDRDRPFTGLAILDGHDPAPVDTPRHLVLVLTGGDAGVAFDAALGVAEKFCSCHSLVSLRWHDLAESRFGLLHLGHRVIAIGLGRVGRFTQDIGVCPVRIFRPLVLALEMTAEVEGHEGRSEER